MHIYCLNFDNSFSRLPEYFFTRVSPTPLKKPHPVHWNDKLAEELGIVLEEGHMADLTQYCSGHSLFPGSTPLAMKYTGHQFGIFNPDLGDGRGLLLGEVLDKNQQKWDLHLKGSGQTPYSRQGDGRAVLRSTIREYLCSEAMHGLGIPTTRALCITGSEEPVYREKVETATTLLRLAKTHIRFGHFEYFESKNDIQGLQALADYTIEHCFPQFSNTEDKYQQLLKEVIERTAKLIAQWQSCGFCHGVMNTDNMSIIGDTFDYGPFAFLDDYQSDHICNHSDYQGRYAFNQQPGIGLWNLQCLARALSPLLDGKGDELLGLYEPAFHKTILIELRQKLGLSIEDNRDGELIGSLLNLLHQHHIDYTLFFRRLSHITDLEDFSSVRDLFIDRAASDNWLTAYKNRLQLEGIEQQTRIQQMLSKNPKYILRNYLLQKAIELAESGDYTEIDRLLTLVRTPCAELPEMEKYADFPPDWGKRMEISCSS